MRPILNKQKAKKKKQQIKILNKKILRHGTLKNIF